MILTRSTRISQPIGPVEPIGTWAAVSAPGVWLDGDARPTETASGNVISRKPGVGGLSTTIASTGAYVSHGSNARMQLSSSSGVIVFMSPSLTTQSSLFSTNLANVTTTNAFYVAAKSTGCVIDKANAANIITTTNAPVVGAVNVLAWRYNNSTGDAAIALNGVLTKATSAQTFTHGQVARGRFRLTDTVQSSPHEQYLFALTSRQISDAELIALSENPWHLFRPVQRRIYFDMGAGGTSPETNILTAPNTLETNIAFLGAISQDQLVSIPPTNQFDIASTSAISQINNISPTNAAVDFVGNQLSISQNQGVIGQNTIQQLVVSGQAISQNHAIPATQASQVDLGIVRSIGQSHQLTSTSTTQRSTSLIAAISLTQSLVGTNSRQSSIVTAGSISQGSQRVADNGVQSNSATSGIVSQEQNLNGTQSESANQISVGSISRTLDLLSVQANQAIVSNQGQVSQEQNLDSQPTNSINFVETGSISQSQLIWLVGQNASQANSVNDPAILVGQYLSTQPTDATATASQSRIYQEYAILADQGFLANIATSGSVVVIDYSQTPSIYTVSSPTIQYVADSPEIDYSIESQQIVYQVFSN